MNSIKDIQKYIEDNGITKDIENGPQFIDYMDTMGVKAMSQEKLEDILEELNGLVREKEIKFVVIDSINVDRSSL